MMAAYKSPATPTMPKVAEPVGQYLTVTILSIALNGCRSNRLAYYHCDNASKHLYHRGERDSACSLVRYYRVVPRCAASSVL